MNGYSRLLLHQRNEQSYEFCLPSPLRHALNAYNHSQDGTEKFQEDKEVKIQTWGEITNIDRVSNSCKDDKQWKEVHAGHFLRDAKLPLLPSEHQSYKMSNKHRDSAAYSTISIDKDTSANLNSYSSAGLLITGSLGKCELQIGSYESREENSSNNSGSLSEEGRAAPLGESVKSFGSGSDDTLRVRHSQLVLKKSVLPSFTLSQEGNAVDLISRGRAKIAEYVTARQPNDQGPHSIADGVDEGNGSYGFGLDINVESPDLVAPSLMKQLATQEDQRKQADQTNRQKALLLAIMQKYDEDASIASQQKPQHPLSSSSSAFSMPPSFQALTRRESEGDKDKHRSHALELSPRVKGRERLSGNDNTDNLQIHRTFKEGDCSNTDGNTSPVLNTGRRLRSNTLDEDRSRSDSNPIRINNSVAVTATKKPVKSILSNQIPLSAVPSNVATPLTVGSASPSRVSFASQSKLCPFSFALIFYLLSHCIPPFLLYKHFDS